MGMFLGSFACVATRQDPREKSDVVEGAGAPALAVVGRGQCGDASYFIRLRN